MDRALVKGSMGKLPPGLASLFNDPPLVGDEKREDYNNFFSEIVAAINPSDAIAWLLARDVSDLSWEIRRERRLKLQIITSAQSDVVSSLLSQPKQSSVGLPYLAPGAGKPDKVAKQWAGDPEARSRINKKLAQKGYDESYISTVALNRAAHHIDAIDRRIATYELRRVVALKAMEHYRETSARRLAASTDVIEGEFTEAAE